MEQNGASTTVCSFGGSTIVTSCRLNGSASTGSVTTYAWTTVRIPTIGNSTTQTHTGSTVNLSLSCTPGGLVNTQEPFNVTLTVSNSSGQTSTQTRNLSLTRAACGS
jgi:hypothetical protein